MINFIHLIYKDTINQAIFKSFFQHLSNFILIEARFLGLLLIFAKTYLCYGCFSITKLFLRNVEHLIYNLQKWQTLQRKWLWTITKMSVPGKSRLFPQSPILLSWIYLSHIRRVWLIPAKRLRLIPTMPINTLTKATRWLLSPMALQCSVWVISVLSQASR